MLSFRNVPVSLLSPLIIAERIHFLPNPPPTLFLHPPHSAFPFLTPPAPPSLFYTATPSRFPSTIAPPPVSHLLFPSFFFSTTLFSHSHYTTSTCFHPPLPFTSLKLLSLHPPLPFTFLKLLSLHPPTPLLSPLLYQFFSLLLRPFSSLPLPTFSFSIFSFTISPPTLLLQPLPSTFYTSFS